MFNYLFAEPTSPDKKYDLVSQDDALETIPTLSGDVEIHINKFDDIWIIECPEIVKLLEIPLFAVQIEREQLSTCTPIQGKNVTVNKDVISKKDIYYCPVEVIGDDLKKGLFICIDRITGSLYFRGQGGKQIHIRNYKVVKGDSYIRLVRL